MRRSTSVISLGADFALSADDISPALLAIGAPAVQNCRSGRDSQPAPPLGGERSKYAGSNVMPFLGDYHVWGRYADSPPGQRDAPRMYVGFRL